MPAGHLTRQYGLMADRYRTADGWSVETVVLSMTPDRHDGEWIRVRRFGFWIRDVRSVEELAELVPLAELEPYGLAPWPLPACRSVHSEPGSAKLSAMSERMSHRRDGRGGRRSKGPRYAQTIRFPEPLRDAIEEALPGSGYDTVNDFVVAVLEQAKVTGFPVAQASQDRLPLSA